MLTLGKKTLLVLFFAGLLGLWWADYAKVPTSRALALARSLVLPELFDVRPGDVRRVEIDGKQGRIVLDRKGERWELSGPIRALASSPKVEGLIATLKSLRKSAEAGTIRGNPADFGLSPPSSGVRLYGSDPKSPIAGLDLGLIRRDQRYARDATGGGIDLVDPRLLSAIESPPADWRQTSILPIPSIDVTGLTIEGGGRTFEADRVGGRWEIVRPARAPGDEQKLEGLVADLVGLDVADGALGFVADDPKDASKYGLEAPALRIEVRGGKPPRTLSVAIGSAVPDAEGRVFARRSEDAEIVRIPSKVVGSLNLSPIAWRSKRVANFDPARVTRIEVRQGEIDHLVELRPEGWQVLRPAVGKGDAGAIQQLLGRLSIFQAVDVREPSPDLTRFFDPPEAEVRLWQDAGPEAGSESAASGPVVDLKIGRLDPRRRVVNVQLAGDPAILGLATTPLNLIDLLPSGPLGFRDRSIFARNEASVDRVSIRDEGRTIELVAADNPIDLPSWRMTAPVRSAVDPESLGRLVVLLSRMRADRLVADAPGDLKPFGLDAPPVTVQWNLRPDPSVTGSQSASETLKVGGPAPPPSRPGSRFAQVAGRPTVFSLSKEALSILGAEFHDHRVLNFRTPRVQSVTLRWPTSLRTYLRKPRAFAGPDDWQSDLTQSGPTVDSEKLNTLLTNMANLSTTRFLQYEGPIAPETGLLAPPLTIDVLSGTGVVAPISLRIGNLRPDGLRPATIEAGPSGAVFLIPSAAWDAYIALGKPKPELPEDVFKH